MRAAPLGELHRRRADTARGTGDQHPLGAEACALDDPLGGRESAEEGG
jgi:hypothetical protein